MAFSDEERKAAGEISRLSNRLYAQYLTHMVALKISSDPRAVELIPQVEPGQMVPILRIPRKDGTDIQAHFCHYLEGVHDPETMAEFEKVWMVGAVLTIGGALGTHRYFDHEPEAEIFRHLRNGVAHGNRFHFTNSVLDAVTGELKYPAHIKRHAIHPASPRHEVTASLHGADMLGGWCGTDMIVDCLGVLGTHAYPQRRFDALGYVTDNPSVALGDTPPDTPRSCMCAPSAAKCFRARLMDERVSRDGEHQTFGEISGNRGAHPRPKPCLDEGQRAEEWRVDYRSLHWENHTRSRG